MKQKKHSHDGAKLTVSLSASLLSILIVAAFCSSSSKVVTKATVDDPSLNTEDNAVTWSPDMYEILFGTTANGTNSPSTDVETPSSENTSSDIETEKAPTSSSSSTTSTPSTSTQGGSIYAPDEYKPSVMFREFYEDEHFIDQHITNEYCLTLSKVERGDLNYFICDIVLASPKALHTAFASGQITGRHYTSAIAESVGAVFAINGDFCGFRNHGIIIREGKLYRGASSDWDVCYLDADGNLNTTVCKNVNANTLVENGVLQSWCFGPTLVKDYEVVSSFNTPGLSKSAREPRVAIGQVDKLHYIILVVDAVRTNNTTIGGMSFSSLAQEFVNLGCKIAYNLDGGGSTTLYYKGKVINTPCGSGERKVSDIIYFK